MSTSNRKAIKSLSVLGVDLGKKKDYSAVILLERETRPTGKTKQVRRSGGSRVWQGGVLVAGIEDYTEAVELTENHYNLTHIERLPLGTAYTDQVDHIKELHDRLVAQGRDVALVVDRGGPGEGVMDIMRAAGLYATGVYITSGHKVTRDGRDYGVPKTDLITLVDVLAQSKRLLVHMGLPYAELLLSELEGFNRETNARGHTTFGNDVGVLWRERDHDDLVLATALAIWWGENQPIPIRVPRTIIRNY